MIDVKLNPQGDAAVYHQVPHGVLRTVLQPNPATTTQLSFRYDDTRFVCVLVLGSQAVAMTDQTLHWLWEAFPSLQTDALTFSTQLQTYLQGDARKIEQAEDSHSVIVAAVSRQADGGRIWLGWLGSAGARVLNLNREPLPIDKGLVAGEGWSPAYGVVPERARPHAEVLTINHIDRLLIFSSGLRPAIEELPYQGRATLQRIADAHASSFPVALLDLQPYRVVPPPEALTLRYRWDAPHEATLYWTGSADATGYRIEQSTGVTFDDAVVIADLTDARQRIYRVQPPVEGEAYYRVVPVAEDLAGPPSPPVVVTPVPLVAPVIDSIEWLPEGGFRLEWSRLPQSDRYELESSPDPDFDSPHTVIVYRGSETAYETEFDYPLGWYFRLRSINTFFAPKAPSSWGPARRAPTRLATPLFEQVSASKIIWGNVQGATRYQVRLVPPKGQAVIQTVDQPTYIPVKNQPMAYQVRALRAEDDEETASDWSKGVSLSGADISTATTAKIPLLDNVRTAKIPLSATDDEDAVVEARPSSIWRAVMITAAVAIGAGLIIGLIGGPRLGIGLDPTPTPLSAADAAATGTQLSVFVANVTESARLDEEVKRVNAVATENANTIANEANRNATLASDLTHRQATVEALANDLSAVEIARADTQAELDILQATATGEAQFRSEEMITATFGAVVMGTLQNSLSLVEATATQEAVSYAATLTASDQTIQRLDAEMSTLEANLDSYNQTIATLTSAQATAVADIANLQATVTTQSALITSYQGQIDLLQARIRGLLQRLSPFGG